MSDYSLTDIPVSPEGEDISMATTLRTLPPFFRTALLAGLLAIPLSPLLSLAGTREAFTYSAHLYAQGAGRPKARIPAFSCDDEIHIYTEWKGLPPGKHGFEILWTDSRGQVWERTEEKFVLNQRTQKIISDYWFAFRRSMFERFFGYELGPSKKAGNWRVEVRLNGDIVLVRKYVVDC